MKFIEKRTKNDSKWLIEKHSLEEAKTMKEKITKAAIASIELAKEGASQKDLELCYYESAKVFERAIEAESERNTSKMRKEKNA